MSDETLTARFGAYFDREVAQSAAKSIKDGAEIEFEIADAATPSSESFTFTKKDGKNTVLPGKARDPQLVFTMNEAAANDILELQSDNIGQIGVHIAMMIVNKRVSFHFKAGFLTLFGKGYFGVLTSGGAQFASFLAQHGLNGIGAIKSLLKKQ